MDQCCGNIVQSLQHAIAPSGFHFEGDRQTIVVGDNAFFPGLRSVDTQGFSATFAKDRLNRLFGQGYGQNAVLEAVCCKRYRQKLGARIERNP